MNYLRKLFSTGAIRKTPQKIIVNIANEINVTGNETIVELGAGKGEITLPVLEKIAAAQNVNYYAFEIDEQSCNALKTNAPRIHVLKVDALNFTHALPENVKVHYFICSIPLSFYARAKVSRLLSDLFETSTTDGKIIILFSAFWLIPFLKRKFPVGRLRLFSTFPPYFLLVYTKNIQHLY